jgi:hypothetical protein
MFWLMRDTVSEFNIFPSELPGPLRASRMLYLGQRMHFWKRKMQLLHRWDGPWEGKALVNIG